MIPVLPTEGPCSTWDERPCRLGSHHDRKRKTGPCLPLRVMRCHTHGHGFTLYPPGHVPYGRKPLAPVAWDGSWIQGRRGAQRFQGTFFEAALDAERQVAWPEKSSAGSGPGCFSTQARHLKQAAALLGVDPELNGKAREWVAATLSVSGQVLHDGAQRVASRPGYQSRGQAVRAVLDELLPWASLFERLALSGLAPGLWPPVQVWHDPARKWHSTVFHGPGTRSPPARN